MIQLRSLCTKGLCNHQPPLKDPFRRTTGPETPWSLRKPRGHRDTTVCLLSDFALVNIDHIATGIRALLFPTS